MSLLIDHIVICVKDLKDGMDALHERTGVKPVFGGRHLKQGTHNALLKLGENIYLELLAVDHENLAISAPRWMGVDLINEFCVTRWALKSNNVQKESQLLKFLNPELGEIKDGERETPQGDLLQWELSIPSPNPMIEVTPFLIDWKESIHPSKNLEPGCHLIDIEFKDPRATAMNHLFTQLNFEKEVINSDETSIQITLDTPKGVVTF